MSGRNYCLKQGIFINSFLVANKLNKEKFRCLLLSYTGYSVVLNVLNSRVSKIGIVLNRVGKSVIFVLNRVSVRGAGPHLPTQGYSQLPPREWYLISRVF